MPGTNTPTGVLVKNRSCRKVVRIIMKTKLLRSIGIKSRNIVAVLITGISLKALAASHTWSGLGANGDWSQSANWSGNNPPTAAETHPISLTFPAGAAKLSNTNNIAGLAIDSILFMGTGYTLNGSGAGTNITFNAANGSTVFCLSGTTNTLNSSLNINLAGNVQFFENASSALNIYSTLQGSGGFTKTGNGNLRLQTAFGNLYAGNTFVNAGTLQLDCGYFVVTPFLAFIPTVAVPGFLEISNTASVGGTVQFLASSQLSPSSAVQIDDMGTLDLNNFNGSVGSLNMNYGSAQTGTGTLTLNGDVFGRGGFLIGILSLGGVTRQFSTTDADLTVYARIISGGGNPGLSVGGSGWVDLQSSNSFTGPVVVNSGAVAPSDAHSFGPSANSVTINNGGRLVMFDRGGGLIITNVSLTLNGNGKSDYGALSFNGTNTWTGPVNLASDSVIVACDIVDAGAAQKLTLAGPITGPNALRFGSRTNLDRMGTLQFSGGTDNSFSGPLSVVGTNTLLLAKTSGATAVPGIFNIGTSNLLTPWPISVVQLLAANQIANLSQVNLLGGSGLYLGNFNDTIGSLYLDQGLETGQNGILTLAGDVSCSTNGGWIYTRLSLGGQSRNFTMQGDLHLFNELMDGGLSSGFNVFGSGSLNLWSSNSFSGPVMVEEISTLKLYNGNHTLGLGSQPVNITNGGALYLENTTNSRPLLLNSHSYQAVQYHKTNVWSGPIDLNDYGVAHFHAATINADQLTLSGAISGGLVNPVFDGYGTVILSGNQDNTWQDYAQLEEGTLILQKSAGHIAMPGALFIGQSYGSTNSTKLIFMGDGQCSPSSELFVSGDGLVDLNNHQTTIGNLKLLNSAHVITGANGLLQMAGEIDVWVNQNMFDAPSIAGNMSLAGADRIISLGYAGNTPEFPILSLEAKVSDGGSAAGLYVAGMGRVEFSGSNSFSGKLTADNVSIFAKNPFAFGNTNSGVVLTNSGWLVLNAGVTNETLTSAGGSLCGIDASGNQTWAGPIVLSSDLAAQAWNADILNLAGPINGPGNLLPDGTGLVRLGGTAPNTFTGATISTVSNLDLAKIGAVAIYGSLQINSNSTVRLQAANQILDTSAVTINQGGTFDLNNFSDSTGDFTGAGNVNLGSGILTVAGGSATNTFSGVIAGNALGEFDKSGGGVQIFSGNNTYTGNTQVKGGTLVINGSQPTSDVYISPGATLGGTGTVRDLYDLGGVISPGLNGPGKLNCGNLTCNSGSSLVVEMKGTTPGSGYDQLNVTGTVTLNSGVNLAITKAYTGGISNQFVIVNNDFTEAVSGTFSGLPQGTKWSSAGAQFQIGYNGNSGNDIVLTQLTGVGTSQITNVSKLGNGSLQFNGTGVSHVTYTVSGCTNLAANLWSQLGTVGVDNAGNWQFTDMQATNFPQRFYRLSYP